jgi:hypothetical protein
MIGWSALSVCCGEQKYRKRVCGAGDIFHQRCRQSRLADPRLAGQQYDLAFAGLCPRPSSQQQFEFFFSPNKLSQAARMKRFEAALN